MDCLQFFCVIPHIVEFQMVDFCIVFLLFLSLLAACSPMTFCGCWMYGLDANSHVFYSVFFLDFSAFSSLHLYFFLFSFFLSLLFQLCISFFHHSMCYFAMYYKFAVAFFHHLCFYNYTTDIASDFFFVPTMKSYSFSLMLFFCSSVISCSCHYILFRLSVPAVGRAFCFFVYARQLRRVTIEIYTSKNLLQTWFFFSIVVVLLRIRHL